MIVITGRLKNILVGLVVLGVVLLAVLGPLYLPKFTKLHSVFDSPINMGLVSVLVVLIALFDIKIGVAFAFLVLMFAVYLMDEKNTQKIETFFANALAGGVPQATGLVATSVGQGISKQEYAAPRTASIRLTPLTEPVITNATGVNNEGFTTGNITTDTIKKEYNNKIDNLDTKAILEVNKMNNNPISDHAQKILAAGSNHKAPNCATAQQYDFLTQQVPGDMRINGYDVVGCRYDLASRPQNLTVYGPPLAWCGTYDQTQASKCGTLFYPLNG